MEDFDFSLEPTEVFQLTSLAASLDNIYANVAAEGMSAGVVPALESIDPDIFAGFNTKRFTQMPSVNYQRYALESMSGTKYAIIIGAVIAALGLLIKFFSWIVNTVLKVEPMDSKKFQRAYGEAMRQAKNVDYEVVNNTLPSAKFLSRNLRNTSVEFIYNTVMHKIAKLIDARKIDEKTAMSMVVEFRAACEASRISDNSREALIIGHLLTTGEVLERTPAITGAGLANSAVLQGMFTGRSADELCTVLDTYRSWIQEVHLAYNTFITVKMFPSADDPTDKAVDVPGLSQYNQANTAILKLSNIHRRINEEIRRISSGAAFEAKEVFSADVNGNDPITIRSWECSVKPDYEALLNKIDEAAHSGYGFPSFHDIKPDFEIVPFGHEFKALASFLVDEKRLLNVANEVGAHTVLATKLLDKASLCTRELESLEKTIRTYMSKTRKLDSIFNYKIPLYPQEGQMSDYAMRTPTEIFSDTTKTFNSFAKPVRSLTIGLRKQHDSMKRALRIAAAAVL